MAVLKDKPTAETHFTDSDRVALATRPGLSWWGPLEAARCEHGHLYFYKWTWREDISDGDPIELENDCAKCNPQDEDED